MAGGYAKLSSKCSIHGRAGFEPGIDPNTFNGQVLAVWVFQYLQSFVNPVVIYPFIKIESFTLIYAGGDSSRRNLNIPGEVVDGQVLIEIIFLGFHVAFDSGTYFMIKLGS